MSPDSVELRIRLSPVELNRLRSKEVVGNARHRFTFLALTVPLTVLAAFAAYSLNDGVAAVAGAALMLLLVPFLLWHFLANPTSALGDSGSLQIISGEAIERVYCLQGGELIEIAEGRERKFSLETALAYRFENGEITLNFPDAMITIPAGSAGKNEIMRFAQAVQQRKEIST